jgi:hypothetical protein
MTVSLPVNPNYTNNAAGTFGISWDGLIQGTTYPDPATRYALRGGYLLNTETVPMWGGVGIFVDVPGVSGGPVIAQGGGVGRATSISSTYPLLGFSVFDQAYGMINSPTSPVPLVGSYGQVMYYLLGSGARLSVAMDAALTSLEGGLINAQVSWDFVNQRLIPYVASYAGDTITAATWNSTTGVITFTVTTGSELSVGSDFTVNGVVATAVGANGLSYNGTWKAISPTSTTTVTVQGVAGTANNPGTYSSGGTIPAGGGALACKIERTYATNCMTVSGPDANSNYTWNRNGAAAVILI